MAMYHVLRNDPNDKIRPEIKEEIQKEMRLYYNLPDTDTVKLNTEIKNRIREILFIIAMNPDNWNSHNWDWQKRTLINKLKDSSPLKSKLEKL